MTDDKKCRILRIDAWRNAGGGWDWNNWRSIGECPLEVTKLSARAFLKWMRENRILSANSAGRVRVEDDQFNLVILERHSGEPLIAVEYGLHA